MPLRVAHNQIGNNAARNLNRTYGSLFVSIERLAGGLKIDHASDDPAGLVISEQMRARIASLNQEIENTTSAIGKYDTTDAIIGEMHSLIQQVRSDAVAAANAGFYDDVGLEALNQSAQAATQSYNDLIKTAEFNGSRLLDGSEGSLANLAPATGVDLSTPEKAQETISRIDRVMANLDTSQAEIGAVRKNDLESRQSNLEITVQNMISAESQLRDADIASEISRFACGQIKLQAGTAMLAHANLTHKAVVAMLD